MGPTSNPAKARLRLQAIHRSLELLRKDLEYINNAQNDFLTTCAPLIEQNQQLVASIWRDAGASGTAAPIAQTLGEQVAAMKNGIECAETY